MFQIPERLILNGTESLPPLFYPPLPENHPLIIKTKPGNELIELILKGCSLWDAIIISSSTACFRRYQGVWEIKDGRFFLKSLAGRLKIQSEIPILADWFSGNINTREGVITIEKGIVTKEPLIYPSQLKS
jgi:hypothetical protein